MSDFFVEPFHGIYRTGHFTRYKRCSIVATYTRLRTESNFIRLKNDLVKLDKSDFYYDTVSNSSLSSHGFVLKLEHFKGVTDKQSLCWLLIAGWPVKGIQTYVMYAKSAFKWHIFVSTTDTEHVLNVNYIYIKFIVNVLIVFIY